MKDSRKIMKLVALLLGMVLFFSVAACKQDNGKTPESAKKPEGSESAAPAPAGEPIIIGAVLPLSSSAGVSGNRVRSGMEAAAAAINADGGIDGRPIKIIFEDIESSDPQLAISAAEKLIHQDKAVSIVGCYGSSASLAVLPICEENEIAMVEPVATSPLLTSGSKWIFRVTSTNGIDAEAVGPYLPAMGFTKIAYLPVDNDWGLSVIKGYIPVLEAAGAETIEVLPVTIGETDYLAQLTKIKNSGANSIIITQDIESNATLIRQIREAGMDDFKILSTSGNNASMIYKLIGDIADDTYYVEYYAEPEMKGATNAERGREFADYFATIDPDTPVDFYVITGYNAVMVLNEAIRDAGSTDRVAIRDALQKVEYDSVRGTIAFDEFGQSHGDVILTHLHGDGSIDVVDYKNLK